VASPYTLPVQVLIDELGKLPGVGPRSAQRLAFHLVKAEPEAVARLARSIVEMKERVRFCDRCFNLADSELCGICSDTKRDHAVVCVVEDARDVAALERTGGYRGLYFVLMGRMSPLEGIGPDAIGLPALLQRATDGVVDEVIIATGFSAEGEVTAHALTDLLRARGLKVTRLARGVPAGSDIEYVDLSTIAHALAERR
jgi:recombination protein RecR